MHQKTPVNKLEQDEIGQDDQSCNFRIQSTKRRSKLHVILGMACHWYAIGMPLVCHWYAIYMALPCQIYVAQCVCLKCNTKVEVRVQMKYMQSFQAFFVGQNKSRLHCIMDMYIKPT